MKTLTKLPGSIFLLAIVHGLLYAFLIPPWQAPDEIAHFEYARLFAEHWRPLSQADISPTLEQEIIDSLYRYQAWHLIGKPTPAERPTRLDDTPFFNTSRTVYSRFSTGYVPYALAVWPLVQQDIIIQLYAMRSVSVLLGAIVVALAFYTARLMEPDFPQLALGTALFLIFLPQHAFIMATVSDGNLAECLAALVIYLLVKMWQGGIRWLLIVIGLSAVLVALLAKPSAYFLLPLMLIIAPSFLRRSVDARRLIWSRSAIGLLGALGAVVVLAAWGLTQPIIIRLIGYSLQDPTKSDRLWAVLTAQGHYSLLNAVWGTFKSYWLTFGWMSLSLPETSYYLLLGLTAAALIGLVIRLRVQSGLPGASLYRILSLSASLPIAILLVSFLVSSFGLYLFQGRYVFGGIVAQALLLTVGWLNLFPRRHAGWALWAMTSGLLFLDIISLGWVVIPFYYK